MLQVFHLVTSPIKIIRSACETTRLTKDLEPGRRQCYDSDESDTIVNTWGLFKDIFNLANFRDLESVAS